MLGKLQHRFRRFDAEETCVPLGKLRGPTKRAPAVFHSDTQDWPGSGSEFNNACQFEVFFLSQLQRCRLHIFL